MANNSDIANNISLGKIADSGVDSSKWVDERLASLAPHETWSPNIRYAESRLHARLAGPRRSWSRLIGWSAVLVTASVILAFALTSAPAPRVLAQKCIDCSIAIWQTISPNAPAEMKLIEAGKRIAAPDFTLTDAEGKPVRLSDRKGKVVLVNFWATWCGGCKVEIPWFVVFDSKYRNAGLDTIGVSLDSDGWTSVRPYLKEKPISYTIVVGNEATANEFNVSAMPVTVLVDRQGRIAATHTGLVARATYEFEIEALLK
jgi:peroxiredoxin